MITVKGFMFDGFSEAIILHHPVSAIPLAGGGFRGLSRSCCASNTVSSLDVCENMYKECPRRPRAECLIRTVGLYCTGLSESVES